MQHGVTFDLTPKDKLTPLGDLGKQHIVIEDKEIPLQYDGRKLFLNIRKPTEDDMEELECVKMTSPLPFEPNNEELLTMRRKPMSKTNCNIHLPERISMSEWLNRLALAREEVVRRTFDATTQMVTNVECENRDIPQRHFK